MADPRALDALRRIERAIARIEAAAERPAPPPQPSQDFDRLRDAHNALRRRVAGAIEQIDGLLETAEAP